MVLKKCWLSLDNSLQLYNFFDYLISRDMIKYPNISLHARFLINHSFDIILMTEYSVLNSFSKFQHRYPKILTSFLLSIPIPDTIASPPDGHNYFANVANKFSFYLTTIRWRKTRSFRGIIATYFYANAISWFISH